MGLSAQELASMQAACNAFLPGTAIVQRVTLVSDGMGGYTPTPTNIGTAICRVTPAGAGAEKLVAEKLTSLNNWVVTLPATTDVTTKDKLVIGARTLEVQAVLAPRSWEVTRRVIASEVS